MAICPNLPETVLVYAGLCGVVINSIPFILMCPGFYSTIYGHFIKTMCEENQ